MRIQFLGATRQVTGSRYYLEAGGLRLMIDCGMFQERDFLGRNWEPSPVAPNSIDYLLLTHAHLDHSGLLPRFVHGGFNNPIVTTAASKDLTEIVLRDAGRIQEEDAAFKKKRHEREKRKGPHPVKPLYTQGDVEQALPLIRSVVYDKPIDLNDRVSVTFHDAGHILGSAMLELKVNENGAERTIVFSGDIGEWDKPIIRDPSVFERADYVVMESTYGARDRKDERPVEDQLCDIINETVERGGNIIIPTFAIERAQELMYYIGLLLREDRIPHLMSFLDSPMAVNVTEVFRRHRDCMDEEAVRILESGQPLLAFDGMHLVRSVADSKAINRIKGSCIIMAGSGMCTAGRIKHHLVKHISRPESTILFVGYQSKGTLGRSIVGGAEKVRIHGTRHKVNARIAQIHGLSAHADQSSLRRWAGHFTSPPKLLFLTHGDDDASEKLGELLTQRNGFEVRIPSYRDEFVLD